MNNICPNGHSKIYSHGTFLRKEDGKKIKRFRCRTCKVTFSTSTGKLEYRQKKRSLNNRLRLLLCSQVSMRRSAMILGINLKTVARRLPYLAEKSKQENQALLEKYAFKSCHAQFDDLVTKEITKCMPLTVPLIVDQKSRLILGIDVGKIPAFGHLAEIARSKYPPRKNEHKPALTRAFKQARRWLSPDCLLESDEHKTYPSVLKKEFPQSTHQTYLGARGSIAGQGELKKKRFDPLFSLNHTCAMLRANISRLARKTWNVSKKSECLKWHLQIYQCFHNSQIIQRNIALRSTGSGSS